MQFFAGKLSTLGHIIETAMYKSNIRIMKASKGLERSVKQFKGGIWWNWCQWWQNVAIKDHAAVDLSSQVQGVRCKLLPASCLNQYNDIQSTPGATRDTEEATHSEILPCQCLEFQLLSRCNIWEVLHGFQIQWASGMAHSQTYRIAFHLCTS